MRTMAVWLALAALIASGWVGAAPARGEEQTELQRLKQQVGELQGRIQQLEEAQQKEAEARKLAEASKKEAEAKKVEPVQAGFGKIKLDGLVQVWGTADSKAADTFRVRRTEIKFSGEATPRLKWAVMFDPSKSLSQTTDKTIVQSSRPLQDAILSWALSKQAQLDIGQYKVPTSEEGMRSSAQLDTIERSMISVRGKWGDIRDVGLMVRGAFQQGEYQVGVFNGEGQNVTDVSDRKDVAGRVVLKPKSAPGLELGLSTYQGKRGAAEVTNRRTGGELRFRRDPWVLKAEYMTGRDSVSTSSLSDRAGWYVLGGYSLDPKRQLVARYDVWDPGTDVSGDRESDLLLGMNWFLEKHNAKFQLNLVRKSFQTGAAAGLAGYPSDTRHVNQLLTNFQVAF